jgi:hypothetical protein
MTETVRIKSLDDLAWGDAVYLAKHGEPDILVKLLRDATKPVPENVRAFLAGVVDGTERPIRNMRIRINHRTRLDIHILAHHIGEVAGYHGRGVNKSQKARLISELAQTTGAKASSIVRVWNRHERAGVTSGREWAKLRDSTKPTRTIVRMGKKVKVES